MFVAICGREGGKNSSSPAQWFSVPLSGQRDPPLFLEFYSIFTLFLECVSHSVMKWFVRLNFVLYNISSCNLAKQRFFVCLVFSV